MLLEAQDRNRPASKRIESDDRRIMSRSLFVAQVTHGDTFDTWSLQSGSQNFWCFRSWKFQDGRTNKIFAITLDNFDKTMPSILLQKNPLQQDRRRSTNQNKFTFCSANNWHFLLISLYCIVVCIESNGSDIICVFPHNYLILNISLAPP